MATTLPHDGGGDGCNIGDPRMILVAGVWSRLWEEDPLMGSSSAGGTDNTTEDEAAWKKPSRRLRSCSMSRSLNHARPLDANSQWHVR